MATLSLFEILSCLRKGAFNSDLCISYVNYDNAQSSVDHSSTDQVVESQNSIGYGLFASAGIPAGGYIGEYTGIVSSVKTYENNCHDGMETSSSISSYRLTYPSSDGGFAIDAIEHGNITRFINHTYNANCEIKNVFLDGIVHCVFVSRAFVTFIIILI